MAANQYSVWTYRVFAVVSAVVLVSGVMLIFWYRPDPTIAFDDVNIGLTFSGSLRQAHQGSVIVWMLFVVALVALEVVRRSRRSSLQLSVVVGLSLVAFFLGLTLPYDQIALSSIRGASAADSGFLDPLFGNDPALFFLIGGIEVETSMLRLLFLAHVVLGAVLLALARLSRRLERGADATQIIEKDGHPGQTEALRRDP